MACSHRTARGPCCGRSYLHDQRLKTSSPSWKPGSSPGMEGRPGLQRLRFVPVVLIKYPDRSNAREKRLIWLTIPIYSSSLMGSQGRECERVGASQRTVC